MTEMSQLKQQPAENIQEKSLNLKFVEKFEVTFVTMNCFA